MDFVLTLHGHLPYVLHHGRWPHGSVWLSEGAFDSYLPLIEALQRLDADHVPAPVTLGITPVLANQLAHPSFVSEFEAYMARRIEGAAGAAPHLEASGDALLVPLAAYWHERLTRLLGLFRSLHCDLIGAFRKFEERGRIELISSAATHGFLPLLARDESIRLQLAVGVAEHKRLFGRLPTGCWLPECAYRAGGPWGPPGVPERWRRSYRPGIEEHLVAAGYRYFFVDSHLVRAGAALGYPDIDTASAAGERTPYVAYRVASSQRRANDLFALVRDPKASAQVWSRAEGYPGDEWYLEFHKIRWPDGLRLWRVTGSGVDLGAKKSYDPGAASNAVSNHAAHFASVLRETAKQFDRDDKRGSRPPSVVTAPFDAELFGHWWFEGVDFLGQLYRRLAHDGIRPVTARQHIASGSEERPTIQLTEGSWGKNGDFSMWLNDQTAWTWQRLWPLEEAYWSIAPQALAAGSRHRAVLAQATRAMLLAQASDWQFIISSGEAADYATQRFDEHCAQAEDLVRALANEEIDDATMHRVEALAVQDSVFPNVLDSVTKVLA
ncbi:MAG TPA: 1,4-alpha-glucan branching protein domain-containing protein [Gemmatimonadales bacterium]|nr:1,4-alpha-glucan branching protein domain-containing protein [Gemmatimonadales bacterium]